jgi:hypothetical protein
MFSLVVSDPRKVTTHSISPSISSERHLKGYQRIMSLAGYGLKIA